MKRLPIKLFLTICFILIFLASCQVKIPKDIIQPDKMEALLYDYHIVQAMGNEVSSMQEYQVKLYYDYLFKKHGVTKALFDSSLVWYTRHPSNLAEIYANLQKSFDHDVAIMQGERDVENYSVNIDKDITIDTLELWQGMSVQELTSIPNNNRLLFSYESDSAFVAGDSIVLKFNTYFFTKNKNLQHLYAAVLVCYNDTTTESVALNIDKPGSYTLPIARNYDSKMNELRGFIYYDDNDESSQSGVVLSELSLLRIHPEPKPEEVDEE